MSFNLSIWNETNALIDHGSNIPPCSINYVFQAYVQKESMMYVVGLTETPYTFDVST